MIAGTAVALSTLSPDITVMIMLFGVVAGEFRSRYIYCYDHIALLHYISGHPDCVLPGSAVGMVFLPSLLAVGFYFDKRKGIAYGIASSGTGIGTSAFAALYTSLERQYTWKGALLIVAGFMLNCTVCGALYRPLKRRTLEFRDPKNMLPGDLDVCGSSVEGSTDSLEPGDQAARVRHSKHCNVTHSSPPCLMDESISVRTLSTTPAVSCRANSDQTIYSISASVSSKESRVPGPFQEDVNSNTKGRKPTGLWRLLKVTSSLFGLGMLLDPAFLVVSVIMALWACK